MRQLLNRMDQVNNSSEANLRRIRGGQKLVDAPPGEKLVITGISGYYPNSENIEHLMENLYNKVDLCDDDNRRWDHVIKEIPKLAGKIYNMDKFDSGYFGVTELQANFMDPMCRLALERSIEAVMDAGMHPEELRGTNAGVFVGVSNSETEHLTYFLNDRPNTYPILGATRSVLAQRVSYILGLDGPSLCADTACSSSGYAFETAYRSIREGHCDMALVLGINICLHPHTTLQFAKLGALNMNTGCRPFDRDAAGYTRAEAVVAIVLQKEKYSRRVYAKVIHSKSNSDGYTVEGITFPSSDGQFELMREVYEECRVDPRSVAYVEAHGTGTKVGDPAEVSAIDQLFCANRDKPLLIGSVKGNIGHSEAASGLCSITRVLFGMNFEYIPPNILFDNPRPDIPALMEKRVAVVTEKTKWPEFSRFGAVNSFGFGGSNFHLLLEKFNKQKAFQYDDIPRLVCVSGRTKHAVETILDRMSNKLDYEFIRLVQEVFSKPFKNHAYRGYSIILPKEEIQRSVVPYNREKYTLYLCLGNENVHSCSILKKWKKCPPFKESYDRCVAVLHGKGVKIQLQEDEPNNVLQKEIATIIFYIGIIDTFKALNIQFDYTRGFSKGVFAAAYANGILELEEALMASYTFSKHFVEAPNFDVKDIQKLSTKLQTIINPKHVKINGKPTKNPYFSVLNPSLAETSYPPFERNAVVVNVDYKCVLVESKVNLEVVKIDQLLICVGRLYELGYNPCVDKLFPEIKWPVSAGTPMFSPLVKWNHSKKYFVSRQAISESKMNDNTKVFRIVTLNNDALFYKGHVIDGRTLFPATGYLVLVWQLFATLKGLFQEHLKVCFENVKFLRATTFTAEEIKFEVAINNEGYFEVVESNAPVASGRVYVTEKFDDLPKPDEAEEDEIPLTQKDIYKELRLRGYHYKGAFRALHQMKGNEGLINWNSNWITFLDNMLQMYMVKEDLRSLAVPTGIDRMLIDPMDFLEHVATLNDDKLMPCYVNKAMASIFTKGIQVIGLRASTISLKRSLYQPVLETYKFVPNTLQTNVSTSMRINMQIILENKQVVDMKILEVLNEESDSLQPLSPEIVAVLEDLPLIKPEITVFTKQELNAEMKGIHLETGNVSNDFNNLIYIGSNILQNEKNIQIAMSAIVTNGFIITIETTECSTKIAGLNILTTHQINDKFLYLLTKSKLEANPRCIDVSNLEKMEDWLETLKTNCTNSGRVFLYAQHNDLSGILGLINCIRREPYGENISCFFIRDKAPNFDIKCNFYKNQIQKGLAINVFQDGQWGTYRHLLCNPNSKVKCKHFCGSNGARGDLSSLEWYQGNLSSKHDNICHIYYSALNFRDVMVVSGKLPVEAIITNRIEQECVQGFEFSGRNQKGDRIMGIAKCGSNSNMVQSTATWKVPSHWSLEDAATVPVVYLTILKAFNEANIKPGQSILIHSGTGGIGQAALNICEYYKCNVFTTVGTEQKKRYLRKHYPYIEPTHIGNSRNTSFEEMILRETKGRGVDLVLNSLSEDKLQASVRCLAKGGYFMEIGKFDLSNDTRISADLFRKGCTYQGINLSVDSCDDNLLSLFHSMLDKSYVKPLHKTVFQIEELESAFRYMASGKHIGKVLIKIRDEEKEAVCKPTEVTHYAIPKFHCEPGLSYIILGGLGGFGLELADWLILRGAKTLILSSRHGITTGYQQSRIGHWKAYGVNTLVVLDDISTYEGCKNLIVKANKVAPVGGIFNLAVELRDSLLENLAYSDFQTSFRPKAYATAHLDDLSRELCPDLHQFVVFSSVSCGRGNAGQANYGMSNSIMERICERRKSAGLPALAVQWGAVGDVGLVAEMQKEATEIAIGGTLQQKISSCLDVLDKFLKQDEPVVSSMIIAEKFSSFGTENIIDTALSILGILDIKSVSLHATFAELGMDSMMAIEMRQTLEREYGVFLSASETRTLTIARIMEINESLESNLTSAVEDKFDVSKILEIIKFDENNYQKTTVECTANKDPSKLILLIPGIEGTYLNLETIMSNLKYSSTCLQYKMHPNHKQFRDVVQYYYPIVKDIIKAGKPFNIITHSFGATLALECVSLLEAEGYIGKVVIIDGSPAYILKLLSMFSSNFDAEYEAKVILKLLENILPAHKLPEVAERLSKAKSTEERKQVAVSIIPDESTPFNKYLHEGVQSVFSILMAFSNYKFSFGRKIKSKVMLIKPTLVTIKDIEEDYELSNYVENLEMCTFEGSHLSILENVRMVEKINAFLDDE